MGPAFFAGKQFVMLWPHGHHDHVLPHLWCAAPAGAQDSAWTQTRTASFDPRTLAVGAWLGLRLDGRVDWVEVAAVCEDAFRTVASRLLIARPRRRGG